MLLSPWVPLFVAFSGIFTRKVSNVNIAMFFTLGKTMERVENREVVKAHWNDKIQDGRIWPKIGIHTQSSQLINVWYLSLMSMWLFYLPGAQGDSVVRVIDCGNEFFPGSDGLRRDLMPSMHSNAACGSGDCDGDVWSGLCDPQAPRNEQILGWVTFTPVDFR